ncbi:YdcF family protein [Pedobacter sp. MC2016-05]|uniref:SanA/YdcF family protein n=1 Tax=Pedobacter sp. MC2016-05 TaxID=2994474 RepID=UPI0022476CF8|nr:ElyC/SanA/YdcF family protein [Pedobacter sp. MC2016-05]MCX2472848.1 YdcF family protein [Pedobacter sp. MC2016-05]
MMRRLKIKIIIKLILIAILIGIVFVFASSYLVKNKTENKIYSDLNATPKTKVAIIFGAGVRNNKPSKYLKDRLDAGISLYKNNKVDKILLSGDNGRDEYDELTVMKLYCYENGVDTNKIYIDYAGFDSYSTMYRAKHIFKVDTAVLVTQQYHLNRCIYIGDELGVKCYGFSANTGIYRGYKYYAFRENLSIAKATLDVLRHRKPRYLGQIVDINGKPNYTKDK